MSVDKMYIILAITIIIIFLEIIYLVFVMVNRSYQNNSIIFKLIDKRIESTKIKNIDKLHKMPYSYHPIFQYSFILCFMIWIIFFSMEPQQPNDIGFVYRFPFTGNTICNFSYILSHKKN